MNGAELIVSALESEGVQQIFGIPLVVLVLQDNAYGMIRWKQAVDGFPNYGMTFGDPDFVGYARAYGAKGSWIERADGLAPALEAAFASGGVQLVSTPIDYSENKRVLGRRAAGQCVAERPDRRLARSSIAVSRHCQERRDEAIQGIVGQRRWPLDCFASLAMTVLSPSKRAMR